MALTQGSGKATDVQRYVTSENGPREEFLAWLNSGILLSKSRSTTLRRRHDPNAGF